MDKYVAKIRTTVGGSSILTYIYANNATQARELIKTLPYFKDFVMQPRKA